MARSTAYRKWDEQQMSEEHQEISAETSHYQMRVLVCGGRDYQDMRELFGVLDGIHAKTPIGLVIHGAYRGADTLAAEWAKSRGVRELPFPADWNAHPGGAAGPIRNSRMLAEGGPDLVVAFPGGSGTADCVRKAERAGVPVRRIEL
jgi:hypothetical protein